MLPDLYKSDVESIIDNCKVIGEPFKGGQKIVFPCIIDGRYNALKFMVVKATSSDTEENKDSKSIIDEVAERAYREYKIIGKCNSPYIIKLGDIGFSKMKYKGQYLLYFSEQLIDGIDLKSKLLQHADYDIVDGIRLCIHISNAISELWKLNKIHRDIKPGNIMYNTKTSNYILLDMGCAFDLEDKSLTAFGLVPGTKIYFSPEQLIIEYKRQMDFRSDLFSLGVVLYETMTRKHPFYNIGMTDNEIYQRILNYNPPNPSTINDKIPKGFNEIIMRLLAKKPHMRYRNCEQLIAMANEVLKLEEEA